MRLICAASVALAIAVLPAFADPAFAADRAVIFMYHHVAEDTPQSTTTSPERFRQQLEFLAREAFTVLPLMDVVGRLRAGEPLPDRTVVLTFDDGYMSVLEKAAPELERRGWPYTVFVSPDYVDRGFGAYLGWPALRELAAAGATIGNHSMRHDHLVRRAPGESPAEHAERIRADITSAAKRLREELPEDAVVDAFAYPFGEYDPVVARVVGELGLVGLGQHSGPIGPHSDWLALPRFPVARGYDTPEEFELRALTEPLDVSLADPHATINSASDRRPAFTVTMPATLASPDSLACFAPVEGRLTLDWQDADRRIVSVRPGRVLAPGRTKINCTTPDPSRNGVYFWFSKLWLTPNPDGSWYSE